MNYRLLSRAATANRNHTWSIATHIEDVFPEEMKKRVAKASSQAAAG
jgi:hypothetical protein